jgi:hypothetical protein
MPPFAPFRDNHFPSIGRKEAETAHNLPMSDRASFIYSVLCLLRLFAAITS